MPVIPIRRRRFRHFRQTGITRLRTKNQLALMISQTTKKKQRRYI